MGVEKPLKRFKKDKSKDNIDLSKLLKKSNHKIDISFLNTPLKSPACKRCPALEKGICKCAKKRLK
ncbi:hypothetical protein CXF74_13135 [Psychromonas sp. Urea-02u-13]|nr:hypothetical protein CXF74_13135 [Psychromonas sp. Urea-02u-13]